MIVTAILWKNRSGSRGIIPRMVVSAAMETGRRRLTAASNTDALDVCMDYLRSQRTVLGLESADLDDVVVADRYLTERTGLTHLTLRQRVDGIPVEGADVSLAVDADGRLVSMGVAAFRGDEKAFFNDADRALYRAKDAGKDCVMTADEGAEGL